MLPLLVFVLMAVMIISTAFASNLHPNTCLPWRNQCECKIRGRLYRCGYGVLPPCCRTMECIDLKQSTDGRLIGICGHLDEEEDHEEEEGEDRQEDGGDVGEGEDGGY
ncbi:uncharacterized protein [Bemisia tabaci]|uniref:uncharacterized protein n=1 Tax=Bemisia tabaci TaxID=7038 RepID=UPI003B287C23